MTDQHPTATPSARFCQATLASSDPDFADVVTWRELLDSARAEAADTTPLEAIEPAEAELEEPFLNEYGADFTPPFTAAWSGLYVYLAHDYDGLKSVVGVLRNPHGGQS